VVAGSLFLEISKTMKTTNAKPKRKGIQSNEALAAGKGPVSKFIARNFRHFNAAALVDAARAQIGVTKSYNPAYVKLEFPGGDVPMETGVCSDVVVRALRTQNADLQLLVNTDMRKNFSAYPNPVKWRLNKADPNIDHRRVLNLERYFTRAGKALPITQNPDNYLPGDIVSWNLDPSGSLPHIGIVSDKKSNKGVPLIFHNVGFGTREDNILFVHVITGHFRL